MQCPAAARAELVLDIDHLLDARQFRRQRAAIAFGRLGARRTCSASPARIGDAAASSAADLLGHRLLQILDPVLHGFVAELLGTAAEAVALQRRR